MPVHRRRKMRCDGQRPACSQCVRAERAEDCEYLDGPGPTPNQMLETRIAEIEGRIAQITAESAPLTLVDPYAIWRQRQANAEQSRRDPMQALVQSFFQNAPEFGFFLHISRFLDRVFYPSATGAHSLRILRNVIHLIGAKLLNDPQEQAYLTRALQQMPTATALRDDPASALYVMQAEVLLANYFYNGGRQLEGVYHTNAAVSIAIASRLHMIRSSRRSRTAADANTYSLPMPVDTLEEGERINGFWTVFILDRCWAMASGSAPAFTDDEAMGTQIDTPWPMDLTHYQTHPFPSDFRSSRTVKSFIAGTDGDANMATQSLLAMQAKAAILYEGATRLASRYGPSSHSSFRALDDRIERFKQALPRMERFNSAPADIVRAALLTHTLVQCASIQLHTPVVQQMTANSPTYEAAHAAVRNLRHLNDIRVLSCVNPFMGILWASVARVISQGIATGRRLRAAGGTTPSQSPPDESTLLSELRRILEAMEQNAPMSPLMSAQIALFRSSPRSS
ncbi:hypothetical protein L226DRAFT_569591 [Lentinus tigrinus ALCF2SS1-7]|uniref:Zn(2)-C6 fungal-type domain-containing protein n=1 Tax=Lentinus tigrinus ALCF2SS1-6 TaxID=1328759 RepID=A0A5C2SK46_9APHY|nr:hypothetical protein L227DRAFT_560881 [Lentinus tigrinus ALCF2SS1-6]RPD76314.1 hypothetical protein L226DRAFT_569591 [Lentinus tigrinus ALCF2SS1-7]